MPVFYLRKQFGAKPHLWLIALIGVIVPRRLRADWRQEWEAELRYRERLLAEWDRLDWRNKLELLRRSASAFWDAMVLQPQRLEDEMFQDLRYGARMLLKNPAFTLVVALSLALGIGANTVVFSLLDAVLLKTLPVKEPERLVLFRWLSGEKKMWNSTSSESKRERDEATGLETGTSFSYPAFEHFRSNNLSLSETFAFLYAGVSLNIDGQVELAPGQLVSGNYFAGLGLPALLGRTLTNDDDKASAEPAAVISYRYWRRRFGGDPAVVGKTINIGDTAFTIAGVAPPEFYGTSNLGRVVDIWAPLAFLPKVMPQGGYPKSDPLYWWLNIMGRLKPGVSARQAQAELDLEMRQHAAELQKSFKDQRDVPQLDLVSGSQGLMQARRQFSEPLRVLMIIVGLVLAVACLNVSNLLLSRAATRRKEIAVRLAAGASRLRLIRQLLTESLLLAVLGGALGLAFAYWGKDVLVALRPLAGTLPDLKLDLRVLGFTTAVTILTGILFGLAPALRCAKVDLHSTLKDGVGQTGYSRSRLSKGLVIAQVAMSIVLLIGAGLFVRTLRNLTRMDLGFNRENLLLFGVNPGAIGYKNERLANLYQQLLERLESTPGVRSATASGHSLLTGSSTSSFCVPGYTPKPGEEMSLPHLSVAANYFETMEMPILQGRGLISRDIEPLISAMATTQNSEGKPPKDFVAPRQMAVINQAMARKYFPNVDPIGRRFSFSLPCKDGDIEIVGVVRDAKYGGLKQEIRPTAYVVYADPSFGAPKAMSFAVRTAGDPAAMTGAIQKVVQAVEPRLPLTGIKTQEAQIAELVTQERLFASLSGFFGLLALVLVAVGLYGVMSYTVARRTHEFGVRMALGAQAADVLQLVMRETFLLALAGVALGIPAALVATRWIESQLFGLTPHDPLTITLVTLSLTAVMALAGYLPARKAARVDPLVALRCE
ncbi:MAG TPA: ABC transporter permease [Blastocatellia bacterium]|nr:ABC transporter permease [Blastocatellia bacterium]